MSSGEIMGRHFLTGQRIRYQWANGIFTSIAPTPHQEEEQWLAPPLFDLQVNGYGGVDFQKENLSADDLLTAVRSLRRDGCNRILLTLVTAPLEKLLQQLHHLKKIRDSLPELRSAIAGWHVEGPFLSNQPGFHGAHNPDWMEDPAPEKIQQLREATGQDPFLLTLAPERNGSEEAITEAIRLGFKISLGHTNASRADLENARAAGASAFTHLGNACPQQLDRHDNILWRVLDLKGLMVGIIPDTIHVSPQLFRLFHRLIPGAAIYYTTDAMAAGGAPPGNYTMGEISLVVGEDQVVRYPGRTNFAGSALRPVQGVFRAAQMLQSPWQQCWEKFSVQPGQFIGAPISTAVGQSADFCLIRHDAEGAHEVNIFFAGEKISTLSF